MVLPIPTGHHLTRPCECRRNMATQDRAAATSPTEMRAVACDQGAGRRAGVVWDPRTVEACVQGHILRLVQERRWLGPAAPFMQPSPPREPNTCHHRPTNHQGWQHRPTKHRWHCQHADCPRRTLTETVAPVAPRRVHTGQTVIRVNRRRHNQNRARVHRVCARVLRSVKPAVALQRGALYHG